MKKNIRLWVVLSLATSTHSAFAEWTSVWETAKNRAYSIEGQIKAILTNDDQQQILIRIKKQTNSNTETLKVCSVDGGSDLRNWQQSEKMALLRQAFARGDRVRLGYSGSFDRCVSTIEYNAQGDTARKTSSSTGI